VDRDPGQRRDGRRCGRRAPGTPNRPGQARCPARDLCPNDRRGRRQPPAGRAGGRRDGPADATVRRPGPGAVGASRRPGDGGRPAGLAVPGDGHPWDRQVAPDGGAGPAPRGRGLAGARRPLLGAWRRARLLAMDAGRTGRRRRAGGVLPQHPSGRRPRDGPLHAVRRRGPAPARGRRHRAGAGDPGRPARGGRAVPAPALLPRPDGDRRAPGDRRRLPRRGTARSRAGGGVRQSGPGRAPLPAGRPQPPRGRRLHRIAGRPACPPRPSPTSRWRR
jgi:hypothetical protein